MTVADRRERYGDSMLAACSVCSVAHGRFCVSKLDGDRVVLLDVPHRARVRAGAAVRRKIRNLKTLGKFE